MVGLTGSPQQVADACRAYRVYQSVNDASRNADDDYLVDHSIVMYLIKPDGDFIDFYSALSFSLVSSCDGDALFAFENPKVYDECVHNRLTPVTTTTV